jgi:SCP-2 sterol transfer family
MLSRQGMIPRTLPPGTTLRSFIEELLPADHAANIAPHAGTATVGLELKGGPSYMLEVAGNQLRVRETARLEKAPLLLGMGHDTAQLFLDDWMGAQKLAPTFEPRGLLAITDPSLIRRMAAIRGTLRLTLSGFVGQDATLLVASGPDPSLYDDPDATVAIAMPAFERLLSGKLGPDQAIADGHVVVTGKKLVAMQYAVALVPYFPPRQ